MSQRDPRTCPRCGSRGGVAATRPRSTLGAVWRTRSCSDCETTWRTYELDESQFHSWRGVRLVLRRLRAAIRALDHWLA